MPIAGIVELLKTLFSRRQSPTADTIESTTPIAVPAPESSWITIGSLNQSLDGHHWYVFHIDLGQPDKPFCFEESVGCGHASGGGAIFLARSDLENWAGDWRSHLKFAGCEWVIEIVETREEQKEIVALILAKIEQDASCSIGEKNRH